MNKQHVKPSPTKAHRRLGRTVYGTVYGPQEPSPLVGIAIMAAILLPVALASAWLVQR